ncbi:hypothetical protein D3C87_1889420 [compost metagenome]
MPRPVHQEEAREVGLQELPGHVHRVLEDRRQIEIRAHGLGDLEQDLGTLAQLDLALEVGGG